jgi:predicted nucleotidyltransferase component of viral defense system
MKLLTPLEKKLLDLFFGEDQIRQNFYLTGGTALAAFHLEHRYSDDLDLFTHNVEIESVERIVEDMLHGNGMAFVKERSSPTFRRYRVGGELLLDLVHDVDFRVGAPELIEGIMVDCVKNIAVNKVSAMLGRLDAKDYVDLYFILKTYDFDIMELIALAHNKDAGMEPFVWSRVIGDVDTLSILPRMIKNIDLDELKAFFHDLRGYILDSTKPL